MDDPNGLTTRELRELAQKAFDHRHYFKAGCYWREAVMQYPRSHHESALARADIKSLCERADEAMALARETAHSRAKTRSHVVGLDPLTGETVLAPLQWRPAGWVDTPPRKVTGGYFAAR